MRKPFILSTPPNAIGSLSLPEDEIDHLRKVLRFSPGDQFVAFDGKGNSWLAEIVSMTKKDLQARVIATLKPEPAGTSLTVAVGSVKGPRMEWAVEKAAELGASTFIPLKTRYAVVEPGEGRSRRWKNIAIAAAKQSRRMTLMEVELSKSIADLSFQNYRSIWVFDLTDDAIPVTDIFVPGVVSDLDRREGILIIIGPEGGFSEQEREFFRTIGSKFVSLGSHPLRTETALVASMVIAKNYLGLQ